MPASRSRRLSIRAVALIVPIAVLVAAPASFANTGSVYYDGNFNVGAGHDFFGGTTPSGSSNVGLGYPVMPDITSGSNNVALGSNALLSNTTGKDNVASGAGALVSNTIGDDNVAAGYIALLENTTGDYNVATGYQALNANTSGAGNTATGTSALLHNTTGGDNVATGHATLKSNTTGIFNVASGTNALAANTSGSENLAGGVDALSSNQVGHNNVGEGFEALLNATGSRNLALGSGAGQNLTTGSDDIDIANPGVAGDSGVIRIGTLNRQTAAFLQGVYGKAVGATSKAVVVNSNGKLGTAPAPAAPALKCQSKTLDRLRAQNRRQSEKLHQQSVELGQQQRTFTRQIQRLRQQMRNGG